ncbi:MAG: threonine/serine dehydratase [Chloroflexi bacterium]|nr:threonine/serine dehydratase [Chloroflexota bacterium]
MNLPTFTDVLRARQTIAPYLRPTPLHHYQSLSNLLGAEVWVKHENHQPIGAFKVRGGVNLMAHLPPEQKVRGVITASTGNHGQSVAFAARLFGVRAIVAMPEGANPAKAESIRNYGAEIHTVGQTFDDCRKYVEETAAREGLRYISSGDEPLLIAGVGTYALEILEALPEVEAILAPIGGGSGAAGICLVAKTLKPEVQVIGVQSAAAPAAYRSWKEQRPVPAEMKTFAEGLATGMPFDLPQAILRRDLDDFVLVNDDELRAAMLLAMEKTRNLVEAAGAASLAGALRIRDRLAGKRVALVMSGGNITLPQLRELLNGAP